MGTRGNWECVHDNSCVHYMCAWCECDMTQHALRLLRISAEKKTCVCVNTKRKKIDQDDLSIGENSIIVVSIIVSSCRYCEMFVCDRGVFMSHQPLRPKVRSEGSDAHGKKSSPSEQTALLPHTPLHHPLFYSHVPLSHNEETRPRLLLLPYLYFS